LLNHHAVITGNFRSFALSNCAGIYSVNVQKYSNKREVNPQKAKFRVQSPAPIIRGILAILNWNGGQRVEKQYYLNQGFSRRFKDPIRP